MDEALIETLAASITRYLAQWPDAADTAEGICHWWIDLPGPPVPVACVQAALERLAERGRVVCVSSGQRQIWRRPRSGG